MVLFLSLALNYSSNDGVSMEGVPDSCAVLDGIVQRP